MTDIPDQLKEKWNAQADELNQWDTLGLDEMLELAWQEAKSQSDNEQIGLLKLLADIREACGDNGKRMQPELVEYIRGLKNEVDRLKSLLREAAIDLNEWGDYVPECFRDKHNLKADILKYQEAGK